jgi:WD40 repeat protein
MIFNIEKIENFTGHKDCVYTLCEGSNEQSFFSAGGDGLVVEWKNADLGKPIAKVPNSIYAMYHEPEKHQLWVANNTEGMHLIDTQNKKEMHNVRLGKVSIFDIKKNKQSLIISDNIGFLHILDLVSNTFVKHIEVAQKSGRCIAINQKTNEMAVGFSDWKIRIYDLENYDLKQTIEGHQNSVFSLQYINNGTHLVSGGRDAHLMLFDTEDNYKIVDNIAAHLFTINHILEIPFHGIFATCSMDKSIKIWNSHDFKLLKVIDKAKNASHGTSVNKLLWNQNNQRLISASDDRRISMWKLF